MGVKKRIKNSVTPDTAQPYMWKPSRASLAQRELRPGKAASLHRFGRSVAHICLLSTRTNQIRLKARMLHGNMM